MFQSTRSQFGCSWVIIALICAGFCQAEPPKKTVGAPPVPARSQLVLARQLQSPEISMAMRLTDAWKHADEQTVMALENIRARSEKIILAIMQKNAYWAATRNPRRESPAPFERLKAAAEAALEQIKKNDKPTVKRKELTAKEQMALAIKTAKEALAIAETTRTTRAALDLALNKIAANGRLDLLGFTIWTDITQPAWDESLTNSFTTNLFGSTKINGFHIRHGKATDKQNVTNLKNVSAFVIEGTKKIKGRTIKISMTVRKPK